MIDAIILTLFFTLMPIVYYMNVDTQTGLLFLSSDTNHSRYVTQHITSSSSLIGKEINTIELWLSKAGNPTGNITIGVFDNNRNVIKEFAVIDATDLTSQIKKYTFTIEDTYKIKANDYIGIYYANGDATNYIAIRVDATNPYDGTNSYRCRYATSWVCAQTEDLAISLAYRSTDKEFNLDKAYSYIISLYDSSVGLVKENASINKYWLWTDNILASKVLEDQDLVLSAKINNKVKEYAQSYNIAFRHPIGALIDDSKVYFNTITDTNLTGNIWYSDSNGVEELSCHDYADIAFYKAIYYYKTKQYNKAKDCYIAGASMFDGYGFRDNAFYADGNRYSTYKLALYKIASDYLGLQYEERVLDIIALMQDSNTGGIYTHYKEDLSIDSMTNVETTALAIMAYLSIPAKTPSSNTDTNLPIQWYIVIGMVLAGVIAIILKRY